MPKVRVGVSDILDARPLAWGFMKGHHADLFATVSHPLPLVGRLLAQGGLDAGLLPAADLFRSPDLAVLPDLCVAFPGAARSLLLRASSPVGELTRVHLPRDTRTAALALRIVLADGYGVRPEYLEGDPAAIAAAPPLPGEGALLIGGRGLAASSDDHVAFDLGAAWHELTGLPLVAGIWAVRPEMVLHDLPFYFKSSLRYGLASLDVIARESAAEIAVDSAELERFFRERVTYFLRDEERAGLAELLARSQRLGLVPPEAAIRYWGE